VRATWKRRELETLPDLLGERAFHAAVVAFYTDRAVSFNIFVKNDGLK
jgi:hypothetical protein